MGILQKAISLAKERNLDICLASTTGNTARSALNIISEINYTGRLVVVRNALAHLRRAKIKCLLKPMTTYVKTEHML